MNRNSDMVIKHIIFDLGGVLLNINPLYSLSAFAELGNTTPSALKVMIKAEQIFEKYDTGVYSDEVFRAELCRILGVYLKDEVIDQAWNSLLLDFPAERVLMVEQISQNFKVHLLSNTNSIHYKSYTESFYNQFGFGFSSLFENEFLSFRMGAHKPDMAIYEQVIKTGNLKAEECLFVDDLIDNAEAAKSMGMNAIHLSEGMDVTDLFKIGMLAQNLPIL